MKEKYYRAYKSMKRYPLLDKELKECKNLKDLSKLLSKIGKKGLYLHGKLRGYGAFNFTKGYGNYVNYLYDDNRSYGKSEVKNLHRVLMVTDR